MAVIETKFSMGDRVRDKLTDKICRVGGFQFYMRRTNSTDYTRMITYIIDDVSTVGHIETYFRREDELEKIEYEIEPRLST
jgi:hypothetical protein